jgi:hypothetical protein
VSDTALDAYLERVEPRFVPIVRALAAAIEAAAPELLAWSSYGMLLHGREAHRREWVCAVGTSSKAVNLRFLRGDLLSDPAGVLRAGSSTLKTIDYRTLEDVDADLVRSYVREATDKEAGDRPAR